MLYIQTPGNTWQAQCIQFAIVKFPHLRSQIIKMSLAFDWDRRKTTVHFASLQAWRKCISIIMLARISVYILASSVTLMHLCVNFMLICTIEINSVNFTKCTEPLCIVIHCCTSAHCIVDFVTPNFNRKYTGTQE